MLPRCNRGFFFLFLNYESTHWWFNNNNRIFPLYCLQWFAHHHAPHVFVESISNAVALVYVSFPSYSSSNSSCQRAFSIAAILIFCHLIDDDNVILIEHPSRFAFAVSLQSNRGSYWLKKHLRLVVVVRRCHSAQVETNTHSEIRLTLNCLKFQVCLL